MFECLPEYDKLTTLECGMDWGREFDFSYYEDRKYNRRYYEINAEMDRVLSRRRPEKRLC